MQSGMPNPKRGMTDVYCQGSDISGNQNELRMTDSLKNRGDDNTYRHHEFQ